jgi:hypothetical protein
VAELELLKLDKDVARAVRAERAFWRTLRADARRADAEAWFEPLRHTTTRTTFQEVASLPESDPLRLPLLAWIRRLAVTRIARLPILALARARQEPTVRLEEPEPGLHAVRSIVHHVLADPERARVRSWLAGLGGAPSPLLDLEKTLREATEEITVRLGATVPAIFTPFDRAVVVDESADFLRRTDDLASSLFSGEEDLAGLIGKLVARDVPGVWPTKPDARWLFDQFQGSPLLQGLTLDLGDTPASLGAASFARALARLGAAYARSAVLGSAPFVVTSDPSDVHPLRRGALLASLVTDPVFLRKSLGLSREAAAATTRQLAATFLAELRVAAVTTALDVRRASRGEVAEALERALKVPVAPELSGAFPRLSMRAAERFAAALLARTDTTLLRGEFDDDWFRNPRGLHALRELDAAPRPVLLPVESLRGTAAPLAQALEAMSG